MLTPGTELAEFVDLPEPYRLEDWIMRGFEMYRTWLYTRLVTLDKAPNEHGRASHVELAEAFEGGDAVEDLDFQIAIVDEILRLAQIDDELSNYDLAEVVYRPYHCYALRELTVYLWAWEATQNWEGVCDVEDINDEDAYKLFFAGDLGHALLGCAQLLVHKAL